MKGTLKIAKILMLAMLVCLVSSSNIIPDAQNPLQMKGPTTSKAGQSLVFRFTLPSDSVGLTYRQFIGVRLPNDSLRLAEAGTLKWTCDLIDAAQKTISVAPFLSVTSPLRSEAPEDNIAYCRINESVNIPMTAGSSYILTVTFNIAFSTSFIHNIGLFTATANHNEKMIIDSLPVYGNIGMYGDWETSTPKPLEITGVTNSLTTVFPYSTFDLSLSFTSNSFISTNDVYILIQYPSGNIQAAQTIASTAFSDGALTGALRGNLAISQFNSNHLLISGITEDLVPGRKFKIDLKQWKALDNSVSSDIISKDLVLLVYYKNTYSVFSYYKSVGTFAVTKASFSNTTVKHVEGWDIYRNGAWPMQFTFRPTSDLTAGGYVVIQNIATSTNKVTFVPASCDFSEFDTLDQTLGKRPNCYPLRHDFIPNPVSGTGEFNAHGMFFNFKSLLSNKDYTLKVWIFADNCGGETATSFNPVNYDDTAFSKPKFRITVYKNIDKTAIYESRLTSTQVLLAESDQITFDKKCFNTKVHSAANGDVFADATGFDDTLFSADKIALPKTATGLNTQADFLLYKEVYDWAIFAQASATTSSGVSLSLVDETVTESYLYATSPIASSSYFFIRARLWASTTGANTTRVRGLLAFPITGITPSADKDFTASRSFWQFSTTWFQPGDTMDASNNKGCYVSWGLHGGITGDATAGAYNVEGAAGSGTGSDTYYKNLVFDPTATQYVAHTAGVGTPNTVAANDTIKMQRTNFIASLVKTPTTYINLGARMPVKSTMENSMSSQTKDSLRIVSTVYKRFEDQDGGLDAAAPYKDSNTAVATKWPLYDWAPFPYKHTDTAIAAKETPIYFGIFSSCIQWKSIPTVKSIYTSIEFQYGFMYNNIINRVNRFVKLYPEAGVFQDKSKANVATANPLIIHYSAVGKDQRAVCLLELNASVISTAGSDSSSNTLLIWIYYGTLLETDYEDASATYPAAPLVSSVSAYGMQNGVPQSRENLYYHTNGKSLIADAGGVVNILTRTPGATYTSRQFSHYQFFMGSWIAITGVSSANVTGTDSSNRPPLLIPFYCPFSDDATSTGNLVFGHQRLPLVMVTWMNMSSHTSFSVNKFVGYTSTGAAVDRIRNTLILNRTNLAVEGGIMFKDLAITLEIPTVTLKFAQYTSAVTNAENLLYLFNTSTGKSGHCTGHTLFLTKDISVDAAGVVPSFPASPKSGTFGINNTKNFFVWGKAFSRAVLTGIGSYTYNGADTNVNIPVATTSDVSTILWTGIRRPTVETFVNFDRFNYIGFFCSSTAPKTNNGAADTNYIFTNLNAAGRFTLDYNPDTSRVWGTFSLAFDKTERIKSDVAGTIRISVTTPTTVPANSNLNFGSGTAGFNANTFCGIVTASGITNDCTAASSQITCATPNAGTSFNICCYNVNFSGDSFAIISLTSSFPSFEGTMYSAANQITGNSSFTLTTSLTSNSTNDPTNNTFKAFINSVRYSNIKQEGGYGRADFEITLPRQPVRDMRITISGDFTNMLIANNFPRCVASFSSVFGKWDNGDVLIESCSTTGFNSSTAPIVVRTKRIVYKCGQSYGKTLYISLWPIVAANWSSSATTNAYRVVMQTNSSENLAFNSEGFNMPTVQGLDAKPISSQQLETLCPVNTINPRIPGERAEYNFEFDLDTNKAVLATNAPNEVTLFFPYNHFGSMIDNVLCYYNSVLTNCSFTDEGILNIRFSQTLPVGSGKRVSVLVTGIPNPSSNSDIFIPCTVNFTNFSTQKRLNLITGTGKITGGISVSDSATHANIRFLSIATSTSITALSNSNPRNTSTHVFRFEIDRANNFNREYSITSSPVIIVSFPSDYKLSWFSNIKPTASIDPYTNDATTNSITKGTSITPTSVTLSGNNVIIALPATSYTFNNTFRYWDIRIGNITGPMDNTTNSARTISTATSAYRLIMTNSNYSTIFRTYSNLNSHAYNAFTTALTPAEPFLSHHRGNTFTFDNRSWVVDIRTDTVLNALTISPGRYVSSTFVIKQNTSGTILPSLAEIKLTDAVFKTLDSTYTVYSSQNESLAFLIGCACGTAPGSYLINFTLTVPSRTPSLPVNWAPLWPVQIMVNNNEVGTISYGTPPTIPAGGSTWVSLSLSHPNFDELNVSWSPADNSKNDSTASLTGVKIPSGTITSATLGTTVGVSNIRCQFAITNSNIFEAQSYKTENPNNCWQWASNTITFNIQGQTAIIPQDYNFVSTITFYNSDSDSTLSKNGIRFNIRLNYAPVYLYCALVCFNNEYPSNDIIKKPTTVNTQLLQFYSGVYTTTTTGSDIVFNGLIRGQRYKLRCIIESVQGNPTTRTSTTGNFEKYTAPNGTTWDVMPSSPQSTFCAQYLFDNEPGQETKIAMINYCQRLFSAPGWSANGCIICTDSELTYTVAGITLPNIQCTAAAAAKLRFLQSTATNTVSSTSTPTTTATNTTNTTNPTPTTTGTTVIPSTVTENKTILFSVCAIASPVCSRDVSGNKAYLDYFNQLRDDLATPEQFKKTLDIVNAQVRSVTTYSDATAPTITTETLKITGVTPALTGLIRFKATFPNPLRCFYQISTSASTSAPTFDAIMNCKDALCGTFKPNSLGVEVSTSTTNLRALTPNAQYNIFVGCTNDVPYSTKRSAVIAGSSFTAPSDTNTVPTNTTCPTGQTFNTTLNQCISSGFINFSFALLMIFAFLFN